MNYISNYSQTFGEKPKAVEDQEILKYRPLRELPLHRLLKPHVLTYIEKWLKINDPTELSQKLYQTLRDMYTRVKNHEPTLATGTDFFKWPKIEDTSKPPRFDKIIEHATTKPILNKKQITQRH